MIILILTVCFKLTDFFKIPPPSLFCSQSTIWFYVYIVVLRSDNLTPVM